VFFPRKMFALCFASNCLWLILYISLQQLIGENMVLFGLPVACILKKTNVH
jgi:hypothetical protein